MKKNPVTVTPLRIGRYAAGKLAPFNGEARNLIEEALEKQGSPKSRFPRSIGQGAVIYLAEFSTISIPANGEVNQSNDDDFNPEEILLICIEKTTSLQKLIDWGKPGDGTIMKDGVLSFKGCQKIIAGRNQDAGFVSTLLDFHFDQNGPYDCQWQKMKDQKGVRALKIWRRN